MTDTARILVCPGCGARNRVQAGREAQATCGKCRAAVFEPKPLELVAATFERQIAGSHAPLLVDFYSPTCGPCLMMVPQFEEAARALHPDVRLAKIDTSAEIEVATRFAIRAVPTLVLFRHGREIARQPGAMNARDIEAWVRSHL
ncbi:thioredoxin fold domain-containing protein [Pseudodesulfovibrio sp. F-1]|uniref:Thioredoxin fold domain-containing protein n=1 Tax=Pseudodesulfovibrio alkaliphilus TaxID=2661613 RepID=A0A7K1KR67_9BACT|nr:thioredoxin domain-containing protein [Pseudodesulfovibrio alkaliphilus]MUM78583.1 thioredoxin fold domain-containing protein [Pseudodesulfovibrio alkaliphilus]